MVLMTPVKDVLRAVILSPSRRNPHSLFVHVFAQPLVIPCAHPVLSIGWRLANPQHGQIWKVDEPKFVGLLTETIRLDALPFLRLARTSAELATAAESLGKIGDHVVLQSIAFAWAHAGRTERALEFFDLSLSCSAILKRQ